MSGCARVADRTGLRAGHGRQQAGRTSHLFLHVLGFVVVWCEVFALFAGLGRLQVSPFFTCAWLCDGLELGVCT